MVATGRCKARTLALVAVSAIVVGAAQVQTLQAQQRTVSVSGTVTDATSGLPIASVSVWHAGNVVTETDSDGRFETPRLPVQNGRVALLFQRIGYAPFPHVLDAPPLRTELNLQVALDRLPATLETIIVEGSPIVIRNPGLVGFYNRREEGFGRYLTEAEIDRTMSFDLTPYMRRLRVPSGCSELSPLVVYLDGIRMPSLEVANEMVPPPLLGGIEVYADERKEQLPAEFIPAGPHCGVVLLWTREPKGPSAVELGGHFGGQLTGEGGSLRYAGGRVVFPLRSGASTLHLHLGFDANLEARGESWFFSLAPALRPLGQTSPWYLGTGLALARRVLGGNDFDIHPHHVLLSGINFGSGFLSPLLEVRLLSPIRPDRARLFVYSGVNLRIR